MKIANIEAFWLRCPIPKEKQHFSDYGLLTNFDMTLIVVTTDSGLQGFGGSQSGRGLIRILRQYCQLCGKRIKTPTHRSGCPKYFPYLGNGL